MGGCCDVKLTYVILKQKLTRKTPYTDIVRSDIEEYF